METPDRHWIDNHAGEACIGRNREPCSVIKDLPLLAMREVFLCHPDLGPRRHLAFSRQTGASMLCPRLPDGGFQESKRTPGIAVWEEDLVPRKTASERSLHATRARKLNHQPSHIDDWMYVKLAVLKINVNENRVKNAYSGGFLCENRSPGSERARRRARIGRRPRVTAEAGVSAWRVGGGSAT
jgi:hypothetical protein